MIKKIQYPIAVNKITLAQQEHYSAGIEAERVGKFVAVRPVDSLNPEGKTFLGLYLGEFRVMGGGVGFNPESGELTTLERYGNPAMFAFGLNRVVFGYESWWHVIETEADLTQISDADIDNVWYVRAMKELSAKRGEGEEARP